MMCLRVPAPQGSCWFEEVWEFRDAENGNFTLDGKGSGCMCKYVRARKSSSARVCVCVSEAVVVKGSLDNVTTLIAARPQKKRAYTAGNVFCWLG